MVWDMLPTDARNAVLVRERFAAGRASEADLRAVAFRQRVYGTTSYQHALAAAAYVAGIARVGLPGVGSYHDVAGAARSAAKALATRAAGPSPPGGSPVAKEWQDRWNAAFTAARAHQAELVRDIFPPPGVAEALRCEPAWLTSTVLALARQADESGEYGLLPILADALQDAGCDNEFMLARCRAESGIHARGNWVVDLLLGRE
jgi:hypothetical protein